MPTLTAQSAYVDFTGSELVVKFVLSGAPPLPDHVGIAQGVGVPTLQKAGGGAITEMIYAIGGWEINRAAGAESLVLWARYRINDSKRIVKNDSGWTVKGSAGLVGDDYGITSAGFTSVVVDNKSEVNAQGWREPDTDLGATVIYVNPISGNNQNDGLSKATAKKFLYDDGHQGGLNLLRDRGAQAPGAAHQLLIAEGTSQEIPSTFDFLIEAGGAAFNKKVYIGTYAEPGDPAVRPTITCRGLSIYKEFVHIQGLKFVIHQDANSASIRYRAGDSRSYVSFQDLYVVRANNIMANVIDRCIFVPMVGSNDNKGRDLFISTGNGDEHLLSDLHVVNGAVPINLDLGHGMYENVENAFVPCRTIYRRIVFLRVCLRDMHRTRDGHALLNLYQCIQDNCGNGPVGGVNGNYRWTDGQWISADRKVVFQSQRFPLVSEQDPWSIAPDSYFEVLAGADHGFHHIVAYTRDPSPDSVTLETLLQNPTGGAIVGRTGVGPWRIRNRTFRHVVSLNTGSFEGHFTGGQVQGYASMLGSSDLSGFWLSESIATRMRSDLIAREAPALVNDLGSRGSSDIQADLLDVHVENLTIARVTYSGVVPAGQNVSGNEFTRAVCRWILCETVSGDSGVGCMKFVGERTTAVNNPDLKTQSWTIDECVYAGPQAGPTALESGAFYYDQLTAGQAHLVAWRQQTDTGGNQQDLASIGSQTYWALGPNQSTSASYHPGLAEYDAERPADIWDVQTQGGIGTRLRLADALAQRPLRMWNPSISAESMVRWALRMYKVKPLVDGWPSLPADRWIGATNYTLPAPQSPSYTKNGLTVNLNWTDVEDARVTRYVVRYRLIGTDTVPQEHEVWGATTATITVNTAGTWEFQVFSTDGWSESDGSPIVQVAL